MTTSEELKTESNTEQITEEEQDIIDDLEKHDGFSHEEEIQSIISNLEENDSAMVLKNDLGFLWKFEYSSVEVLVQLTGENEDDLFTVWAVVLQLPANNEAELMKKLLEMNWSGTFETCFAIFDDQVVISTQRTVDDLSPSEISRAITLVATIADENSKNLQSTYGNK